MKPGAKPNKNSLKLKATLGELESALTSWDNVVATPEATVSARPSGSRSTALNEEMRRRTRELLDQLKSQIDELSSEDPAP